MWTIALSRYLGNMSIIKLCFSKEEALQHKMGLKDELWYRGRYSMCTRLVYYSFTPNTIIRVEIIFHSQLHVAEKMYWRARSSWKKIEVLNKNKNNFLHFQSACLKVNHYFRLQLCWFSFGSKTLEKISCGLNYHSKPWGELFFIGTAVPQKNGQEQGAHSIVEA